MTERVIRLVPKPEVLRELYLKSGNVCAFPGCMHPIVDTNGVYVAQMCHIEAAEELGQRFNPKQTNEERRQFDNLLLMCHRHHKETDDVERFPVSKMRQIKRQHEAKFEKVLDSLAADVYDLAFAYEPKAAKSVQALVNAHLISDEEADVYLEELGELVRLLHQLSPITRKIYLLVVNRTDSQTKGLPINEFQYIVSCEPREAYKHIAILERYGLLFDDENTDEFERRIILQSVVAKSPYPAVLVLRDYCKEKSMSLSAMLVDLDFSALNNDV